MTIRFGLTLQPEMQSLDVVLPLAREFADYLEVAPETMVRPLADDRFEINSYGRRILEWNAEARLPFVAHGVSASVGTVRRDPLREKRWLECVRITNDAFHFEWYTDHSGTCLLAGEELILPMMVPHRVEYRDAVRSCLATLSRFVPTVGIENSAAYFALGDPLAEADFLADCVAAENAHLVLDLHNVYTSAINLDFDPRAFLERVPLHKVIEIHVSGGSWSDPNWMREFGGKRLRLDSHDSLVPDEVIAWLGEYAPRCPNLRGVTLERMEGTLAAPEVAPFQKECARFSKLVRGLR